MENIGNNELEQSFEQKQNSLEKAMSIETDRLFSSLESSNTSDEDIGNLVCSLSKTNPLFNEKLLTFKDFNSVNLKKMLTTNNYIDINNNIYDYFGIKQEFEGLNKELQLIGLELSSLLSGYKDYIENNLNGLPENILIKIKESIIIRLSQIGEIISELKKHELATYGNLENFGNNRWIINGKIQEHLGFISNELFPSLEAYLKIKSGVEIPKKNQNKVIIGPLGLEIDPNYINIEEFNEEITELMQAKVSENGDFDEGFFSTQNILNTNNGKESRLLNDLGVGNIKISLLNEKDKAIENKATLYFMAMIAVQIGVETLGGIPGTVIGGGIDLYDTFSRDETLLKISQAMGLTNKEFRMDKTWIDNVLAGLGLIPGATQIIKGSKLAKFMKKIDPKAFEKAIGEVKKVLKIEGKQVRKIEKITDPELLKGIEKLIEIGVPKEYIEMITQIGISENKIINKYKKWLENDMYKSHIETFLSENPNISLIEAHAIYGYTNGLFYKQLNKLLRDNNTEGLEIAKVLRSGIEKMPPANKIQFRGENETFNNIQIGDFLELKGFTSSSNNPTEPFWSELSEYQVIINESNARNVSELSFFVNFAETIGLTNTKQESIILPGSLIQINNIKKTNKTNKNGKQIIEIIATQIE